MAADREATIDLTDEVVLVSNLLEDIGPTGVQDDQEVPVVLEDVVTDRVSRGEGVPESEIGCVSGVEDTSFGIFKCFSLEARDPLSLVVHSGSVAQLLTRSAE